VACINFINLSTARSALRANEVGVRKVAGSTRGQLIRQFLTESVIYSLISLFLAIIIVEIALPYMNNYIAIQLTSTIWTIQWFPVLLVFSAILLGVISGIYPAFLLSAFKPIDIFRGKLQTGGDGKKFRNSLALIQFATSIVLIVGTIVIYNQLQYVRNKDLGFNKEQIVIIPNAARLADHQQIFKERLKRNVGIVSATYTDCMPQMMLEVKPFQKVGAESHENHTLITIMADYDFMQTFQFQLVEGRFFQKSRSMDSSGIILNEAAVRSLDYKEPLREELIWMGLKKRKMNVIGVIRDFHIESMHTEIRPMSVLLMRNRPGEFLSVRIARDNIPEILKYIREQWNQIVPQQPLEYLFFDDQFAQLYQIEIQSGKVFTTFAVLAIFIACLGLFGLASFTVVKRTKEIGIRKVLGASVPNIFFLLSKEFSRWVILSNIIAWPVAWYFMNKWLENFAYRINIHWWFFVIAGLVALLISLITIIWQALRTATANPADSLRYE
jgi:putative ABC transport system permease protein